MGPIRVALHAENKTLISEGLAAILKQISDVQILAVTRNEEQLSMIGTDHEISILFLILKDLNEYHFEQLKKIREKFHRMSIVVVSSNVNREVVFKAVKSGARGFISADTSLQEIQEAVYTIRSGHDFFSSTITNLLITDYVDDIRNDPLTQIKDMDRLSKRELEILTLWGEGLQNVEIASRLFISIRTVETHKNHIMQKLGIHTTVDLLKFAIRNNLISI